MIRFLAIPLLPLVLIALFFFGFTTVAAAQDPPSEEKSNEVSAAGITKAPCAEEVAKAKKILNEIDDLYRGDSSQAIVTMGVKTKHWERTMKMEAWSMGKEYSLMKILEPKKERGTATLKAEKDIFNYLPKTGRTIKITSGMMSGSWMGSHFTNDDLVKESRMSDDFDPTISFEGERNGEMIWEFTLIPKEDAAVVWGKIVAVVRQKDHMPLIQTYYDEDMELTRTMTFEDFKTIGGRFMPAIMKLVPEDKPEEFTAITYNDITFGVKLDEGFFTLQNLKRQ